MMAENSLETLQLKCTIYEAALNSLPLSLEICSKDGTETVFRNNWKENVQLFVHSFNLKLASPNFKFSNEFSLRLVHGIDALREAYDTLPNMVWIMDVEGKVKWMNKYAAEFLQFNTQEIQNFCWAYIIHPNDLQRSEDEMKLSIKSGRELVNEFRVRRYDGEYVWFSSRATPQFDASGSIKCWIVTNFDINDMKLLEQKVQEANNSIKSQKRLFRSILQTLPVEVICAQAPSGELIYANPKAMSEIQALADMKSVDDYRGYPLYRMDGKLYEPEEYPLARSLLKGEVISNERIQVITPARTYIMNYSSYPIYNEQNAIEYAVVVGQDVTELLETEKEHLRLQFSEKAAREASQMKSTFLATMSHEIRTPLNGVLGMAGILLEDADHLTQEQLECVSIIKQSGTLLLTIINDVLDFCKVDAGKLELTLEPFRLKDVIMFVEKLMLPAANRKCLKFHFDVPDEAESLCLVGDAQRIQQILINLVGNAIKFSSPGKMVSVTVKSKAINSNGFLLTVTVTDEGIGMSEKTLKHLYQPFTQADSSTTRHYGGSGLGLSICKRLIELMAGTISVQSERNVGTAFTFELTLPASRIPCPTLREASKSPVKERKGIFPKPLEDIKILVAEDNPINAKLITKVLKSRNLRRVDVVSNGLLAIEKFQAEEYDLIFMDCQMPVMDGYEATRKIRALEANTGMRIPIIALTAEALVQDRQSCLEAGMDAHVSKPFQPSDIDKILEEYLYCIQ